MNWRQPKSRTPPARLGDKWIVIWGDKWIRDIGRAGHHHLDQAGHLFKKELRTPTVNCFGKKETPQARKSHNYCLVQRVDRDYGGIQLIGLSCFRFSIWNQLTHDQKLPHPHRTSASGIASTLRKAVGRETCIVGHLQWRTVLWFETKLRSAQNPMQSWLPPDTPSGCCRKPSSPSKKWQKGDTGTSQHSLLVALVLFLCCCSMLLPYLWCFFLVGTILPLTFTVDVWIEWG